MARLFPMTPALTPQQRTFTANATWPTPAGVTELTRASGKGANGSPGGSAFQYSLYRNVIVKYDSPEYGQDSTNVTYQGAVSGPVNYCDPAIYYPAEHATVTYCYATSQETVTYPATTGASTTGFNRTFPGGAGGPASTTTFDNVPLTQGANNQIVVPVGGSLTIFWMGE